MAYLNLSTGYVVFTLFPFDVVHVNDINILTNKLHNQAVNHNLFHAIPKRLSAEKLKLLLLEKHYKSINQINAIDYYKERIKNIEEEHPEWLV